MTRRNAILMCAVVGACGLMIGAAITYRLDIAIWRDRALAAYGMAMQANDAGKQDEAIILLSQAIIANPNNYEPLSLLANLFWHRGNRQLALELYRKALDVADKQHGITRIERNAIRGKIDILQKQVGGG